MHHSRMAFHVEKGDFAQFDAAVNLPPVEL